MNYELLKYETLAWEQGISHIAGIDEVGRGSLAGPMVVGAVILDMKNLREAWLSRNNDVEDDRRNSKEYENYAQIKDSKLISAKKRERLSEFIMKNSISWAVFEIDNTNIDKWGIAKATQEGFVGALKNLKSKADHVFTDTFEIKRLKNAQQTNIVAGDKLSMSIAAASIVAKVYRDSLMVDFHNSSGRLGKYGFDRHKGYGTKAHREAISEHGVCEIHRLSFEPVKSLRKTG